MNTRLPVLCLAMMIAVACANSNGEKKKDEPLKKESAKTASPKNEKAPSRAPWLNSESKVERPKTKLRLTEEKLNEVRSLKEKLEQKKALMDKKAEAFAQNIASNVEEIKAERDKRGLKEFKEALTNAMIKQCLMAIQKAKAYKELSEREALKTQLAMIELDGTDKQLCLDKTMFEDLDEAQIDELLRQIDFVLDKVSPQAEEFKVTDEETVREPLEKLYEEYIRKDEREQEQKKAEERRQEEIMRHYYDSTPRQPIPLATDAKTSPAKSLPTPKPFGRNEEFKRKSAKQPPMSANERSTARPEAVPVEDSAFDWPKLADNPYPDSPFIDALDQCQAALDNDNCQLAQTLCTENLRGKFSWLNANLSSCFWRTALERCQAAIENDNCELAETLCADPTLKDSIAIETAKELCWIFRTF